jgi:hypothetical protein
VIKVGAEQLENSSADFGFVLVNIAQLFPHEEMFENFRRGSVTSNDASIALISSWLDAFLIEYAPANWTKRLRAMKKLASVMFFVPTVGYIHGAPNPFIPYYGLHIVARRADAAPVAEPFECLLNSAMQSTLSFRGHPVPAPEQH